MVEHATENRGVGSSTLPLGTCERDLGQTGGSGAVVARLLAKEKVAGSNPVFRSIPSRCSLHLLSFRRRPESIASPARWLQLPPHLDPRKTPVLFSSPIKPYNRQQPERRHPHCTINPRVRKAGGCTLQGKRIRCRDIPIDTLAENHGYAVA